MGLRDQTQIIRLDTKCLSLAEPLLPAHALCIHFPWLILLYIHSLKQIGSVSIHIYAIRGLCGFSWGDKRKMSLLVRKSTDNKPKKPLHPSLAWWGHEFPRIAFKYTGDGCLPVAQVAQGQMAGHRKAPPGVAEPASLKPP